MDKRIIPAEKFRFVSMEGRTHDKKFETKPIGYFQDAWIRFKKNRASVAASIIIIFIFIFSVLTPYIAPLGMADVDGIYGKTRPKLDILERSGFWDGGMVQTVNNRNYTYYQAIGIGAESYSRVASWDEGSASHYNPIISTSEMYESGGVEYWDVRVDSYYLVGFQYITLPSMERFNEIQAWEKETGLRVIYPMIDTRSRYISQFSTQDANFWYRHADNLAPLDANDRRMTGVEDVMRYGLVDNYLRDDEGNIMYYRISDMTMLNVRVLYYNYYQFLNGRVPTHVLGADTMGYDIWVRLASGTLLSLMLAFSVSLINLTIGAYLGAIQGYYGRTIDLVLQRVTEIISNFPFIILYSLIAMHLVNTGKMNAFWGLIFAFVISGWIGTSRLVRMQFYRFKNQEYILAARTLGAKDNRLMFRHIFPNAIGTIITGSVLVIPSVIFSESTLSYLGIVNFDSLTTTSLGTMLANGRGILSTDPHVIAFPSAVISLLMISFNLFGNGLRDAFNPSLRGVEE